MRTLRQKKISYRHTFSVSTLKLESRVIPGGNATGQPRPRASHISIRVRLPSLRQFRTIATPNTTPYICLL